MLTPCLRGRMYYRLCRVFNKSRDLQLYCLPCFLVLFAILPALAVLLYALAIVYGIGASGVLVGAAATESLWLVPWRIYSVIQEADAITQVCASLTSDSVTHSCLFVLSSSA